MKKGSKRDKQIIQDIRNGGDRRTQALKQLFEEEGLRDVVRKVIEEGGGLKDNFFPLLKECIVGIDRQVRLFAPLEESLLEQLTEMAKVLWGQLLAQDERLRRQSVEFVAVDTQLSNRLKSKIAQNGGVNADVEDFYQNGIIKLQENLAAGKYKGGALKGYFLQICFNLWRNSLRAKKAEPIPEEAYEIPGKGYDPQQLMENKEFDERWAAAFAKLSERCQKILTLRFFRRTSFNMQEIAERMGLKNAQNASNALAKCKNRLKDFLTTKEE